MNNVIFINQPDILYSSVIISSRQIAEVLTLGLYGINYYSFLPPYVFLYEYTGLLSQL